MTSNEISNLELVDYVNLLESMAVMNGSTPEKINYDYYYSHGVVSEERYEEAVWGLGIRKAVEEYFDGLVHA
jgi:hypothetical protein